MIIAPSIRIGPHKTQRIQSICRPRAKCDIYPPFSAASSHLNAQQRRTSISPPLIRWSPLRRICSTPSRPSYACSPMHSTRALDNATRTYSSSTRRPDPCQRQWEKRTHTWTYVSFLSLLCSSLRSFNLNVAERSQNKNLVQYHLTIGKITGADYPIPRRIPKSKMIDWIKTAKLQSM